MRKQRLRFEGLWSGTRPTEWPGTALVICCRIRENGRKRHRPMRRAGRMVISRRFGICAVWWNVPIRMSGLWNIFARVWPSFRMTGVFSGFGRLCCAGIRNTRRRSAALAAIWRWNRPRRPRLIGRLPTAGKVQRSMQGQKKPIRRQLTIIPGMPGAGGWSVNILPMRGSSKRQRFRIWKRQ